MFLHATYISKFARYLTIILVSILTTTGIAENTFANDSPADAKGTSYVYHQNFASFLDEVVEKDGQNRSEVIELFETATRKDKIIDLISRPAEKTMSWNQYQKLFITRDRVKKGVQFYQQYKVPLLQAHKKFGVPPEMIVAVIGVETLYGRNKGHYRVIDALSTLAFDYPPRSKFFRQELREYLKLKGEAGIDLYESKGSYAGAMGYGQFIPSSYRHYGIDFSNDRKIDLINNPVDAIGSVANYFKAHGWKTGQPVTSPAHLQAPNTSETSLGTFLGKNLKPRFTIKEIKEAGLIPNVNYPPDTKAMVMTLEGANGKEYWVGLKNFYVITRYNHSRLYAMAVYQLSNEIKQEIWPG